MVHQHMENTGQYFYQLMKTNQSSSEQKTYRFPTPEQPGDAETFILKKQQIHDELMELKQLEQLNPNDNEESKTKFIDHFDTTLSPFEKQQIEDILVQ